MTHCHSNMNAHLIKSRGSSDMDYYKSLDALYEFFCPEGSTLKICAKNCKSVVDFLDLFNPKHQLSFDQIGHKCVEFCTLMKIFMRDSLISYDAYIGLTVDISRSGKRYNCSYEYLCLTAHCVDSKWNTQRMILSFGLIGSDGGGAPHDIIIKTLKEWDLESKITSITMVDCDYREHTLKVVKDHIQSIKALPLSGRLFKLNCSADIVNQIVQYAFGSIDLIVDKIRKHHDVKEARPKTWKARSSLLKDLLKYRALFTSEQLVDMGLPEDDDWEKVSDIINLVDDIYNIVYVPFQLEFPTANIFLPHLQELQSYLMKKSTNANPFIISVAQIMLCNLKRYMKEMYLVFALASVMDPRFKMKYIEFSSCNIEGDSADSQVKMVLEALHNLYDEYVIRFPKEKPKGNSARVSVKKGMHRQPAIWQPDCVHQHAEFEALPLRDDKVGFDLLIEYNQAILCATQHSKSELECYLEEPVIPWFRNFDTLGWWKVSSSRFPILSRMARDLISIPGCVATGDEAILMKQRKANYCVISSGPDCMDAFMCFRRWLLQH